MLYWVYPRQGGNRSRLKLSYRQLDVPIFNKSTLCFKQMQLHPQRETILNPREQAGNRLLLVLGKYLSLNITKPMTSASSSPTPRVVICSQHSLWECQQRARASLQQQQKLWSLFKAFPFACGIQFYSCSLQLSKCLLRETSSLERSQI